MARALGLALGLLTVCLVAAEAPSRFATLDGARVHYKSYGAGKEAVVFIHAWTCDLTFWRLQAPVYEKRRSLLIDLPGHGASDKPQVSYTQELLARAVAAVMRDAGVEKAVLVGHSMGAPVAMTLARLYPGKASGLVLVDAFIPRPPKDDAEREKAKARAAEMAKAYRSPDYKASMTKMIDGMFAAATSSVLRDEIRAKMLATPQHVVASALEGMFSLDLGEARFDLPVMAIVAKRETSRAGYEEYLRRFFPNLRAYQEWENVGHFLMMEQPEKFNAALVEFLERQ